MSGLEHKYNVSRVDGRDGPGGDREGTRYFVLDPANDPTAWRALWVYANTTPNKDLSNDLFDWLKNVDKTE